MKRLKKVTPAGTPYTLELDWDDGGKQIADLSGLVALSRHFTVFAGDPDAFAKVNVVNWGHGVEWDNGLDYSAENLGRIADEQSAEGGQKMLLDFQTRFKLTNEQLGAALGYRISQVKNFKAGANIPAAVGLAIRAMTESPTMLYARMKGPLKSKMKRRQTARKDAA